MQRFFCVFFHSRLHPNLAGVFLAPLWAIFQQLGSISRTFQHSGRNLGVWDRKSPARQQQIGKPEQAKQLCRVLGQAARAHLAMTKQALDDVKRCSNFVSSFK